MNARDWYRKNALPRQPAPQQVPPQVTPGHAPPAQPGYPQPPVAQAPPNWHGSPVGQIPTQDAIRVWKGSVGAQTGAQPCPQCGAPDGFLPAIAIASESSMGVNSNTRLTPGSARSGHCFYCGFRQLDRSDFAPPTTGLGIPGARTEGQARNAHGINVRDPHNRPYTAISTAGNHGTNMRVARLNG